MKTKLAELGYDDVNSSSLLLSGWARIYEHLFAL